MIIILRQEATVSSKKLNLDAEGISNSILKKIRNVI